jgi:RNA polymerase sigma factor (sigma-70 family)
VDNQPPTALALLERAKAGDKDAFGTLAEEHRQALLRLCYKMTGSHEQAEDLVQDTLLKAFTHIAEFELRASLNTWLYRIATNACLDHQRGRKPWDLQARWDWFRDNGDLVQQMEQTLFLSPERSAEVKEVAATCVNCITMSLPAKQRAAITLCDQVGLSREEAAKAIGASVASVKTELHRARKTMTGVFESQCQLVDEGNECSGCLFASRVQRQVKDAPAVDDKPRIRRQRSTATSDGPQVVSGIACAQIDELLSERIADELPEGMRATVDAHLAGCRNCTTAYRQLKRTVRFVRSHASAPLEPGTTGGVYAEFTKSMMDGEGARPLDIIMNAVPGLSTERDRG